MFNEITDEQVLLKLRLILQNGAMIGISPFIAYQLSRAWILVGGDEWYQVEIVDNINRVYRGMMDAKRGVVYLEVNSLLSLVQDRIDRALQAYNSGHDPRFRGM
jgi:hypothetical protein